MARGWGTPPAWATPLEWRSAGGQARAPRRLYSERWGGGVTAAGRCRGRPSAASRNLDPADRSQRSAYELRSFPEENARGESSEKPDSIESPSPSRKRSAACRNLVPTVRSVTPSAAAISRLL